MDPYFHRRDLADAIEAGAYPKWELGIQTFPDTEDQSPRSTQAGMSVRPAGLPCGSQMGRTSVDSRASITM